MQIIACAGFTLSLTNFKFLLDSRGVTPLSESPLSQDSASCSGTGTEGVQDEVDAGVGDDNFAFLADGTSSMFSSDAMIKMIIYSNLLRNY